MIEFKDKLKTNRIAKKLTQEELAKLLNVTRQAVSKWEQGRGIPDVTSLKNIAKILEISIDDLLSNEETKIMMVQKSSEVKKSKRLILASIFTCLLLCATTIIVSVIIRNSAETSQIENEYNAEIVNLSPDFTVDSYGETRVLEITDETKYLGLSGSTMSFSLLNIGDYVSITYFGSDPTKNVSKIQVFDQAVYSELKGWFMYFGNLFVAPNETYSGDGYISTVQQDKVNSLFGLQTFYGDLRNIKVGTTYSENTFKGSDSAEVSIYFDPSKITTDVYLYKIFNDGFGSYLTVATPPQESSSSEGKLSAASISGKRKYLSPQKGNYYPMSYDVTYTINFSYMDSLESALIYEYSDDTSLIGTIPVNSVSDISNITIDDLTKYVIIEQTYKSGDAKYTKRTAVDHNGSFDFLFCNNYGVIPANIWKFI